jgi:epoxyqueuosine reductase
MSIEPHETNDATTDESAALVRLCEQVFQEFIDDPRRNNLGPGASDPAWEDFLLGFAAGDDPLWHELKTAAGPEHWTPDEAFGAAMPAVDGDPGSVAGPPAPAELTVISWAISQTEATKASNRRESRMPSEPWARARIFGQQANAVLHLAVLDALRAAGYEAVAPGLIPAWREVGKLTNRWHSTWSERHVAYVSGLGTFGLSGGLITAKGQAVRFGSVIVKAFIPATPRPYSTPFAYCLELSGPGCAACADRCPTGSVDVAGRDKPACSRHVAFSQEYVTENYGFAGYGCGLCQTGVPCESSIPEELRPAGDR